MSWGTELWDKVDNVSWHTQRGIEFLDRCGNFFRDRASLENDYGAKLRKLAKAYLPKKKTDEEDLQFTSCGAFRDSLNELNDLAGQHELIAEFLMGKVVKEINVLVKEFKEEKKRRLQEAANHHNSLQGQIANLDRTKKVYEKAHKEAERAVESYHRADADINLSRADVEKTRNFSQIKNQQCEDSKRDYANVVVKTNEFQRNFYTNLLPSVLRGLQAMDERRVLVIQHHMRQSVVQEKTVQPIINRCLEGITKAVESVDEKADSQLVVDKFKSGYLPPGDFPFEDLSSNRPSGASSLEKINQAAQNAKLSGGLFAKKELPREDFADLPPHQRKKKLQQKIDEISARVQQTNSAKDGLERMQGVYIKDRKLGDPAVIDSQLKEVNQQLSIQQQELDKFQNYLREMDFRNSNLAPDDDSRRSPSNISRISQTNSESGISSQPIITGLGQIRGFEKRPSVSSSVDSFDQEVDFDPGDDSVTILGTCRAMYSFEITAEGNIAMNEGELFHVLEMDDGSGWTRVKQQSSPEEEGFVPTSYLEITLYPGLAV